MTQAPPRIIYRKVEVAPPDAHPGATWKIAYADLATAMMAFFLLLWLLAATGAEQRRGIAGYFAPTFGTAKPAAPPPLSPPPPIVVAAVPPGARAVLASEDRRNFDALRRSVADRLAGEPRLSRHIRFATTREGLRIELADDADYAMFAIGTSVLADEASVLLGAIAAGIARTTNPIMIRGHTDALPFGGPRTMNNWTLSSGRAEATRQRLVLGGISEARFRRIEGVADREPIIAATPADPRNRRVAITLLYRDNVFGE